MGGLLGESGGDMWSGGGVLVGVVAGVVTVVGLMGGLIDKCMRAWVCG